MKSIKFPVNTAAAYDALLKSTEMEMKKLANSPPMELVPVKSEAGGFVMRLLPVGARDMHRFLKK